MAEFEIVDEFTFEVGLLPREKALGFSDYLNSKGIRARVKRKASGHFAVFVTSSVDAQKAKQELLTYQGSPYSTIFTRSSWEQGKKDSKEREVKSGFYIPFSFDPTSITTIVEIICILVYLASLVMPETVIKALALSRLDALDGSFPYYKLLTPTFVHFGIMHIAFNLVMWEALARPVERVFKKAKLFQIFIAVALISNVCQYSFMLDYGYFGGLSGVVYGVIGYSALVSKREDIGYRFAFPQGLLMVSAVFIGIGFFLDGIANLCHLTGLVLGIVFGFIDLKRKKI